MNLKNGMDENEIRRKVRESLEKKHLERQQAAKEKNAAPVEEKKSTINILTPGLQAYIIRLVDEEIYADDPHFFRCSNHLNEIKWLTQFELNGQYEYYQLFESRFAGWKKKVFGAEKKSLPEGEEIKAFYEQTRQAALLEKEQRIAEFERLRKVEKKSDEHERLENIIAQEEINFYRNHPDYREYRNYAGQTKWMTREEYDTQDEYIDIVRTPFEIAVRVSLATIGALALLFGFVYLTGIYHEASEAGFLVIDTGQQRGQLYIDEAQVIGFTPGQAITLSPGEHRITFRKNGYEVEPKLHLASIATGDTVRKAFTLTAVQGGDYAKVLINSPFDDAKVFVNNEFQGTVANVTPLNLQPGKYRIALSKEDQTPVPPVIAVDVSAGTKDTVNFRFVPVTASRSASNVSEGLLDVSANIRGARILINGRDTGFQTDYVMSKIPFGSHVVSVEKEGYKSYPRERQVEISRSNSNAKAHFNLSRLAVPVTIATIPARGAIFIDGKEVGEGSWNGSLPIGDHVVTFGKLEYYSSPEPAKIIISEEGQSEFTFTYNSNYRVSFAPDGITPSNIGATIQTGFLDEAGVFVADPQKGPKPVKIEALDANGWRMGHVFTYNSTNSPNAVQITFTLPRDLDLSEDRRLTFWGYRSGQNYPLELLSTSRIQISVNNRVIQDRYTPTHAITEAGEETFERFSIGQLLRHGKNSVTIATGETNTTFFVLWKLRID